MGSNYAHRIVLAVSVVVLAASFAYAIMPATASADVGLVARWTMDDGSGSTASDSSGNGNNAAINGPATWVAGKINGALSFNGSTNYARVATFSNTPASTMTLCSWIKTSSATEQDIISFGRNGSGNFNEGVFRVLPTGGVEFWDYSTQYGFPLNGAGSDRFVADGHWHQVCFSKNGTAGTYYVDGIASGTTTAVVNVTYGSNDWVLGSDYRDNDSYFNGLMDDARVYNIALTPAQIAALYGATAYWKFDEGSGTVANDSTGNNNTGTIVGSPAWTTGKINDALSFGYGKYVSIGGSSIASSTVATGQITGTAWIYANSATSSGTIIKDWPADSSNDEFQFGFDGSTGKIGAYIEQSNGTVIGPIEATSTLSLGAWHLVAFTANGSSTALYIDGTVVASTTYNGTLHQGANYIGIGAVLNNTGSPAASPGYFDGKIDDVHLYNRGLLPEEITNLLNTVPTKVANLHASGSYSSGFSLTWDQNPAMDNVTDYVVQYSTDGGNSWNPVDTASTSASYTVTGDGPGDYLFEVAAENAFGRGSESDEAEINSQSGTYTLTNDCLNLEHLSTSPGDAYGHYTMTANIDCSTVPNFSPIAFSGGFGGTFDGAGYSITNLTISTTTIDDVGLFSRIRSGAMIKNLTISNATVSSAGHFTGILAGYNNGTLQTISVGGTATGAYGVGGLVGQNDTSGTISTSSASVQVVGNDTSGGEAREAGGFVGEDEGTITNSYSTGTVTNAVGSDDFYYVGGFAGVSTGGTFTHDYATGPIVVNADSSNESDYIGGFAGAVDSGTTISYSYATGSITDPDDYLYEIGGFVGESSAMLDHDYATGDLHFADDGNGSPYYLGGFVGGGDNGVISNSYSTGSITGAHPGTYEYVGGFAGYNDNAISNSYSTGSVVGSEYIGGFTGYSGGTLSEVFATGDAVLYGSSPSYAGGLAGINYDPISDAYATGGISLDGGVSGTPSYLGGLVGYNSDSSIQHAYASGSVAGGTNSADVGGLIGKDDEDASTLQNAYATGAVSGGTNVGGLVGLAYVEGSGNPAYSDVAWLVGSASNAIGDFQINSGGSDNGPVANLSGGAYGTDESTLSNFYATTEPVYAQGQGGAWDFSSIWESHVSALPTFQGYTGGTTYSPPPTVPAARPHRSSGGSVSNQISNLLSNGNAAAAAALKQQYPNLFSASSTPVTSCAAQTYPTAPIKFGAKNDPAQVTLLEEYLNTYENAQLPVTGVYSAQDVAAVIAWQEKYASVILAPWNIKKGTGYVYTTSLNEFRNLFLAQCQNGTASTVVTSAVAASGRDLEFGMSGDDVRALQQELIKRNTGPAAEALAKNGSTGYFGQLTKAALIEFQKAAGILPAAGYYGSITRAYISAHQA